MAAIPEESPDSRQMRYLGRCKSIKGGVSLWIVPQKITAKISNNLVRVKMGGKSTRLVIAILLGGKPYREQGKAAQRFICHHLMCGYAALDK